MMRKMLLLPATAAIAVACAVIATPAFGQAQQPAPSAQAASYSDAQLRAYAAAKAELDRLGQAATDAQRLQVLGRHNLDAATYTAIAAAARTDRSLAQRIASLETTTRQQ